MTIKGKLCVIALVCTMLTLSICLCTFSVWQSDRTISNAEEQARDALSLFCANLESLDRTAQDRDELTGRSVVQYYFATYAHILSNDSYYALVMDGEYLYNTCPYDPKALIDPPKDETETWNTVELDGHRFIVARPLCIFGQEYIAYLCTNVSEAYTQVEEITKVSLIMLMLSAVTILLSVIPLVRHALAPVDRLRRTAEAIAGGEYHLRAEVTSSDEVAALADAFNHMTVAVNCRIDALTEESERRRLLLGALAHEIKTPMTAVIGFADSLLKMPLDETQRQHCAEQILSAGQRTERITAKLMRLLSLSTGNGLDKQYFSACELADDIRQENGNHVCVRVTAETLYGDRDLVFSLTQNLISNALQASAPSQSVEVTLGSDRILVSDHGCGISPEHLSRLTEPFYRVDKARSRRHGGAGLGLALCKAISEAHGGALLIESTVGSGTTVTALLCGDNAAE